MGKRCWPGQKEKWRWICLDSSRSKGLSFGSPKAGGVVVPVLKWRADNVQAQCGGGSGASECGV